MKKKEKESSGKCKKRQKSRFHRLFDGKIIKK
jgi:hypothetical protein